MRLTSFATNTKHTPTITLELRHRQRARVEARIRTARATGPRPCGNLRRERAESVRRGRGPPHLRRSTPTPTPPFDDVRQARVRAVSTLYYTHHLLQKLTLRFLNNGKSFDSQHRLVRNFLGLFEK